MSLGPLEREWQPFTPCPCGCGVVAGKLTIKMAHAVGCTCRSCIGLRNRRKGQKAQSRVLKDAAKAQGVSMEIAPTHEEQARLLVHYESKQGEQVPKGMRGAKIAEWEKQARGFAERQIPRKKWALVLTFPGGKRRLWMDYDQWLSLVSEIQELP